MKQPLKDYPGLILFLIFLVSLTASTSAQTTYKNYVPMWFGFEVQAGQVACVSFNRDFSIMAAGTNDGRVIIYDIPNETVIHDIRAHSMAILSIDFAPDGKSVATTGWDAMLRAWSVETGKRVRNTGIYDVRLTHVKFSGDGNHLAVGTESGSVIVYPVNSSKPNIEISLPSMTLPSSKTVNKVAFSPNGKLIAAASTNGLVFLLDAMSGEVIKVLEGKEPSTAILTFTDDSEFLIQGDRRQMLMIYKAENGDRITEIPAHINVATGVYEDLASQVLVAARGNQYQFYWNPYWQQTSGFDEVLESEPELARLLKPRGQFEKPEEAFVRQYEGYRKYSSRIIRHMIEAESERLARIQASIKPVVIPPSELQFGTYDITEEKFPITIRGEKTTLPINRDDAKSLFENKELLLIEAIEKLNDSLTYTETVNIVIVHPITGSRYEAGRQYDIETFRSIASLPAALSVDEATFTDSDGDGILGAGEHAVVQFTVSNAGPGPAQLVRIVGQTSADISGLSAALGTIEAGDQRAISLTIKGGDALETGQAEISFAIKEMNGFNADPISLKIPTRTFLMPSLHVAEIGVEDPQGRSMISPGMVVDITLRVKNDGPGNADQVRARITAGESVFIAGTPNPSQTVIDVGVLGAGTFRDVTFQAFANNEAESFPLEIFLTESTGRFKKEPSDLGLTLFKPQKSAQEMTITARAMDNKSSAPGSALMSDISRNIPLADSTNADAVAVIVGNRTYQAGTPPVAYALNDAQLVRTYVEQALGYRPGNILYLEDATLTNLKVVFGDRNLPNGRLKDLVKEGRSDVFVFYSGHGAPDPNSNKGYLMPVDADPSRLELTGYGLDVLYENLSATGARSITVVVDACFSGATGGGDMLIAQASPIGIRINDPSAKLGNRAAVITASTGQQVASWYPEMRHGLLTYYFLKGIQGAADADGDGNVTLTEMDRWLNDESDGLPYMARRLHSREQSPQIWGDQNFVLR
jgi:hypothetical protein